MCGKVIPRSRIVGEAAQTRNFPGQFTTRILGVVRLGQSVTQERSRVTDPKIMLQNMLPVGSVTEVDVPTLAPTPEGKLGPLSTMPLGPDTGVDSPGWTWARVCFSCGHHRHEVSRCSRMVDIVRHGRTWLDGIILREKRDGPGGRVSLPDHRRS